MEPLELDLSVTKSSFQGKLVNMVPLGPAEEDPGISVGPNPASNCDVLDVDQTG